MAKKLICPFCLGKVTQEKFFLTRSVFSYKVCGSCGGGVLVPKPKDRQLRQLYRSKKYFTNLSSSKESKVLSFILNLKLFDTPAVWVEKNFDLQTILDVGCGNGEFLDYLKNKEKDVYGVDISEVAAKNTGDKIGRSKVRVGEFPEIKFSQKFDVVSLWHVLEHLENPHLYLKTAKKVLHQKGFLVGEVPNFDSLTFCLFKKNYNWIMVPEHRIYFSKRSLGEILERVGFKNVEIYYTPPRHHE